MRTQRLGAPTDIDAKAGVQSVEIGMRVLSNLADLGGEQALGALAKACGLTPAKAHRYLASLIRTGFVERSSLGKYALGWRSLAVGLVALARLDVIQQATAALYEFRERVDETVMLSVWGPTGPVIVRWLEASRPVTVNGRVGTILPLLRSASGQVFTAFLPEAATSKLLHQELKEMARLPAGLSLTSSEMQGLLDTVRLTGFGRMRGNLAQGVRALAVPVFGHDSALCAAIAVLGPEGFFDDSLDGETARSLRAVACDLSRRLGYREG